MRLLELQTHPYTCATWHCVRPTPAHYTLKHLARNILSNSTVIILHSIASNTLELCLWWKAHLVHQDKSRYKLFKILLAELLFKVLKAAWRNYGMVFILFNAKFQLPSLLNYYEGEGVRIYTQTVNSLCRGGSTDIVTNFVFLFILRLPWDWSPVPTHMMSHCDLSLQIGC